jgi:TonB-linked SusC/RagA family outer membrane protein
MNTFHAGQTWYSPVLWKNGDGSQVYVDDDGNITNDGGVAAYMFPQEDYFPYGVTTDYVQRSTNTSDRNVFNVYSTYNLSLGREKEHALKFMLGMNRDAYKWNTLVSTRNSIIDPDDPRFENTYGEAKIVPSSNWESQLGFFGRINYAFNSKYLLEANLRYDASSKFPKHLRWRWYPSFSGGWVISNEEFMKPLDPILSFAKFRASWGSIGNQAVNNNLYYPTLMLKNSTYTWLGSDGSPYFSYSTPSAIQRDITWERFETLNLGIDMRFIKDKVGVSFDWYQRNTRNLIMQGDALPYTYGTSAPQGNYGNMRTRGWEIAVDFNHRFANGIGINGMFTLSDATTYITKGPDYRTDPGDRLIGNTWSTGRRYGDIYGYVTDRLYQADDFVYDANGNIQQTWIIINGVAKKTNMLAGNNPTYQTYLEDGNQVILFSPGDVKYVDLNGDGIITPGSGTVDDPGDRKVIGNTTPRYEYGIRLGADYKGFDMSVYLQGIGKRDLWGDGNLAIAGYNAKEGAIPQTFAEDYWKADRTDAFYPRAWDLGGSNTGHSMQIQTRYLLDMSYLRIKNITFGYSIPPKLLKKVYLTKARFYVSLENFFTFDNLRGLPIDPEAVSGYSMFNDTNYNSSRTGMGTPTFKTASFGVQLNF